MAPERIGRVIRALRHRRDWRQEDVARRVGCSRSVISRLEAGSLQACSSRTLASVLEALGARLVLSVDWRGGELQRLLDADHALLAERWAARRPSWVGRSEVTYSHYGERGSVDELAFHSPTGTVLVVELKTGIYDAQHVVARLDQKARLAGGMARRLGWTPRHVVSWLVVADSRTNRRRVEQHPALFGRWDVRGRRAMAWLRDPAQPIGGLLIFVPLSDVRGTNGRRAGRQRVRLAKGSRA
jgi:transcriptional regulator with XRE-family HTH domain